MTRTVRYFSYQGSHINGKDSTSAQAVSPEICAKVLQLTAIAKEHGAKSLKFKAKFGNETLTIPMPRIKHISSDDFGQVVEITMSDKSWRRMGAHV